MTSRSGTGSIITSLVIAGFTACALVWFATVVVAVAHQAATEPDLKPSRPPKDWRPDITHCHSSDVELWDCIRGDTNAD